MGKQFIALKDHADFLPGGLPGNVFAEFADTVHHDAAALVRLQTVDAAQECGFAAAGRAQQYDDFAFFQDQV